MRKIVLLPFLLMIMLSYAKSQNYIGLGSEYIMPIDTLSKLNQSAYSYNLQIESRNYCRLWYGLSLSYYDLAPKDSIISGYFKNVFNICPQVRYNFSNCKNYRNKIIPYIQSKLIISSISDLNESPKLGLGYSFGLGVTYGFTIFKNCFHLDLNVSGNSENGIYKFENRPYITTLSAGLNLSARI